MISPMMVITTSISTSVKPRSPADAPRALLRLKLNAFRERLRQFAALANAVCGLPPERRISRRRHDVDQNSQRRREIDSAAKQNAEIATKQAGPIDIEDGADYRQARQ